MVAVHTHQGSNETIASHLATIASLLEAQGASQYRVAAYQRASETLRSLKTSVETVYRNEGLQGLIAIPTIGLSIAHLIGQYLRTHEIPLLQKLQGKRVSNHSEQDQANRGVQLRLWDEVPARQIPIAELLSVDDEFCSDMKDRVSRVNPDSDTVVFWRTQRGDRSYTARYSTSPRAQQLHTTNDWVIISCDDRHAGGSWTVVTTHQGRLNGCRTVRGREAECYQHYRAAAKAAVLQHPLRMK